MDKAGQTILLEDFSYPDTNEPQVTSSIVTLEPGAETGLHFHEAPMYAYILEGTLEVTYQREGGEETKIYREGEAIMEGLDTPHNGRNATNSAVRVLVVNMGSPDLENTVMLN
jgi:quercetin dioxygenase-like cupin family protein